MNMNISPISSRAFSGLNQALSQPLSNRLMLVVAPHAAGSLMLELAARLSLGGAVRVLDGGNRFNVYPVASALRRLTGEIYTCLGRITLSRAFTCYQMLTLLEETPAIEAPTLLLDFLGTFYDESVKLEESLRLLDACLPHMRRLGSLAPLVISTKPAPPVCPERSVLVDRLRENVDQSWVMEPVPVRAQPTLWDSSQANMTL
jgi:hypothetical protein